MEATKSENSILRQKLQSKSEALLILSKELQKVRVDCEEYRDLTQKLQMKCSTLKRSTPIDLNAPDSSFNSRVFRDYTIAKQLSSLRLDNQKLMTERERLVALINEREEDVRVMRWQLNNQRMEMRNADQETRGVSRDRVKEVEMLERLEALQAKYSSLKQDLQVKTHSLCCDSTQCL